MSDFASIFGSVFDPNSVEPAKDIEVLPPGKYPFVVEKAEIKVTQKGDGHYVALTLCITDSEYKNRKLWPNINIDNPNEKCRQIGASQLSALCLAIGLGQLDDSSQLVGGVGVASVTVKDGQNNVRTYKSMQEAQQEAQAAPQQPPQQQQPTGPQYQQPPIQPLSSRFEGVPQQPPVKPQQPPWARPQQS